MIVGEGLNFGVLEGPFYISLQLGALQVGVNITWVQMSITSLYFSHNNYFDESTVFDATFDLVLLTDCFSPHTSRVSVPENIFSSLLKKRALE